MFYDRQTKVFTDIKKAPKQSKAAVLVKVFIGSSLIFYGLIATIYFAINNLFILSGVSIIVPIIGLFALKKPDPEKLIKKEMRKFDNYNSLN